MTLFKYQIKDELNTYWASPWRIRSQICRMDSQSVSSSSWLVALSAYMIQNFITSCFCSMSRISRAAFFFFFFDKLRNTSCHDYFASCILKGIESTSV